MCFVTHKTFRTSVCRWRHKIRKIAVEIFAKCKQTDAEFAGNSLLRMVFIDIVIKTLLGGATRHPAGMHCPSWDDASVSSLSDAFSQQKKN